MDIKPRYFKDEIASFNIKDEKDFPLLAQVATALSHEIRLNILNQIQEKPRTIPELAELNDSAITAIVYHAEILKKAGFIDIQLTPSQKGNVRTCYRVLRTLNLQLWRPSTLFDNLSEARYSCGVGDFVNSSSDKNFECNFATEKTVFFSSWNTHYRRERHEAMLIWINQGYLTYAFPNDFATFGECAEINISLEICSEFLGHNNHFPSDITFYVNDVELFTFTSPGDFGDRPGRLNPDWWANHFDKPTQYGELKNIKVNATGAYLNGDLMNTKASISKLGLNKGNRLLFKVENKPFAKNVGGFNIFGREFGDYPQDIELVAKVKQANTIQNH